MKLNFRLPAEAPAQAPAAAPGAPAAPAPAPAPAAPAAPAAPVAAPPPAPGAPDGTPPPAAPAAPAAAAPAAPTAYTLTLPPGGRLDATDLKKLETIARANDWTNDEAQAYVAEKAAEIEAQAQAWAAETTADPELGGDKLAATQVLTKAGIDALFPEGDPHRDSFIAFMGRGGAGNNINVVRALARIGKMRAEDGAVGGNSGGGAEAEAERLKKPLAQRVYPNAPA